MKKKFLMVLPLQPEGHLQECMYQAKKDSGLGYAHKTRFPIIPVIANHVKTGEQIAITVILTKREGEYYAMHNYALLKNELEVLSEEKNFHYEIHQISTEYDDSIETELKLFMDIIQDIEDEEQLYACITFGNKPIPVIITMAMNYAYKIKREVNVQQVVYGRFDHLSKEKISYLHDITTLFFMDSIVNKMAEAKIKDPEAALRMMLQIAEE